MITKKLSIKHGYLLPVTSYSIYMHTDCIFCKIIKREIDSRIVFEDEHFIVIHDIKPIAPVHVLIITKEPYDSLESVDIENTEIQAGLLQTARKVARQLHIADNYKLMMNVGKKVQFVHHIHLHLLGGWDKTKTTEELDKETVESLKENNQQT